MKESRGNNRKEVTEEISLSREQRVGMIGVRIGMRMRGKTKKVNNANELRKSTEARLSFWLLKHNYPH